MVDQCAEVAHHLVANLWAGPVVVGFRLVACQLVSDPGVVATCLTSIGS